MDFEGIGAIFQVVRHARHRSRQLARLAHRYKSRVQPVSQRRPKDETTRLDAQHQVDLVREVMRRQRIDQLRKPGLVFQQCGDVVEQDPRLGKIRHGSHQLLQVFHVDGFFFFRHDSVPLLNSHDAK